MTMSFDEPYRIESEAHVTDVIVFLTVPFGR